jgi:2-polyprenyl-6-methoxyphenol hydroxylase-like FAD-dependent oxidoreductase
MKQIPSRTDVIIVGAGPTGLMLANQLARRGVRPLIIDKRSGPSLETRALGVQARTLEIYSKLGVVERALELGKRSTGADLWASGRRIGRVPLGQAGASVSPYPFVLVLGQDDNERILTEKLLAAGVCVAWNTELAGLEQKSDHVVVALRDGAGSTRNVRAAWVAGCDGARSKVRELCGIEFPGAPYEHVFFVADVEATGRMVPDEVNAFLWRDGFHLFFPMRGQDHWRIVGILPPQLRGRQDVDFNSVVPSIQKEAGTSLVIKGCSWFSTYKIHHRSATQFRDRRCFVLGDAAHVHSPMGAQGMNTGLQDAYNLGWKLALVAKGQADEALLDSYHDERLPVARKLLNTTDRVFRLIVSDGWFAGLLRTRVLAKIAEFALRRSRVQRVVFGAVSQTAITYRGRSLSQAAGTLPHDAPQAGDRFPWLKLQLRANGPVIDLMSKLEDTRFHLLAFGQSVRSEDFAPVGDLVEAHEIPAHAGNVAETDRCRIPRHSFYLLRPDGHVAVCGARLDAQVVIRYLKHCMRLNGERSVAAAALQVRGA